MAFPSPPLYRRRRDLAIGALAVLLHIVVIRSAVDYAGNRGEHAGDREHVFILSSLGAKAPAPPPAAPPAPPPRPVKAMRGDIAQSPPAPAMEPEPVPEPEPIPLPDAVVASVVPEAVPIEALAPIPAPPKPVVQPSYKVNLPPSADLTLDVARTDANGTKWNGSMAMSFKRSGTNYRMTAEASISVLVARVNLAVLTSEGKVDEAGLSPRLSTEKRRGRSQTATHFRPDDGLITFSASERSYPLQPGTQDKATVPMQLAGIARADPAQMDGGVHFLVGEDKDATVFNFTVVGQEELDTPLGRLRTWHLTRPPRPGAYNSRLDVWLAPAHYWYPVQIRNTEGNGAVTTQTIRKIVVTDSEG